MAGPTADELFFPGATRAKTPEGRAYRAAKEAERRKRPGVRDQIRANARRWLENPDNLEKKRKQGRERQALRLKNDPEYVAYMKWHRAEHRTALKHNVRRNYGLTLEAVDELRKTAACEICGSPAVEERHGYLSIDHDHATGKIRGMLCNKCNSGLGYFKDNPEVLQAAAAYLKSRRSR